MSNKEYNDFLFRQEIDEIIPFVSDLIRWEDQMVTALQGATITVFEDTPAGIRSVKQAGIKLQQAGADVTIQAFGITNNPVKKAALESEGARIAANINLALDSLDNF